MEGGGIINFLCVVIFEQLFHIIDVMMMMITRLVDSKIMDFFFWFFFIFYSLFPSCLKNGTKELLYSYQKIVWKCVLYGLRIIAWLSHNSRKKFLLIILSNFYLFSFVCDFYFTREDKNIICLVNRLMLYYVTYYITLLRFEEGDLG